MGTFKLCSHQAAALRVRDRIGYRNELSVSHQEISRRFDSRLFTCPRKSMWYCFALDKARASKDQDGTATFLCKTSEIIN